MGSEISMQSCVTEIQNCTANDNTRPSQDVYMVQLQQPFGLTLHSKEYHHSLVKAVFECESNGNAAVAGVVAGMILLQINGVDVQPIDLDTLSQFIFSLPTNKVVTLTFLTPFDIIPKSEEIKKSSATDNLEHCDVGAQVHQGQAAVAVTVDSQPPSTNIDEIHISAHKVEPKRKEDHVDQAANTQIATVPATSLRNTSSADIQVTVDSELLSTKEPSECISANKVEPNRNEEQVKRAAENQMATVPSVFLSNSSAQLIEGELPVSLPLTTDLQVVQPSSAAQDCPLTSETDDDATVDKKEGLTPEEELAAAVEKTDQINIEKEQQVEKLIAEHHEDTQSIITHQLQLEDEREMATAERLDSQSAQSKEVPCPPPDLPAATLLEDSGDDTLSVRSFTGNSSCDDVSLLDVEIADDNESCALQETGRSAVALAANTDSDPGMWRGQDMVEMSLCDAISPACVDTFSNDDKQMIVTCMALLRKGIQVKKHNLSVNPSAKWLHVDSAFKTLYWRNKVDSGFRKSKSFQTNIFFGKSDSEREVALTDIVEVRDDCSSAVMKRSASKKFIDMKDESCHVLSLILENRTLNFEIPEASWTVLHSSMKLIVKFLTDIRSTAHENI